MKTVLIFPLTILYMVLTLSACSRTSNYAAEISDLNGTWQPGWSYKAILEVPEEERSWSMSKFSWGEGKSIPNTTFNIDISAEKPFIKEPGLGSFPVTKITQAGINSIKVNAFRADQDDPQVGWFVEVIFHFIDRDTLWIESKDFDSTEYGKKALWYRLSGPTNSDQILEKTKHPIINNEPLEFANGKWLHYFGKLAPKENISLEDIQSCSWHSGATYLNFSKEGNYAIGERWTGPSYGVYELHDNIISFNPPFQYFINSVEYQVDKLYYSNEMHYFGAPVLKNINENLDFYPNECTRPELGETVKINGYYCEKIWEKTKINKNNILYSLPDRLSINVFDNDYFGKKAMEASVAKVAKITIDNIVWYNIGLDFTGDEPSDGGGPFYKGWLPEEYLE